MFPFFLLLQLKCLELNESHEQSFVSVLLGVNLDIVVGLIKSRPTQGTTSLHKALVETQVTFAALRGLAGLYRLLALFYLVFVYLNETSFVNVVAVVCDKIGA